MEREVVRRGELAPADHPVGHDGIELVEVLVEEPGVVDARLGRDGQGPLLLRHRLRGLRRLEAVDVRAERAEHRRGLPHGALDLGVDLVEEERLREGQAQSLDAILQARERIVRAHALGGLVPRVLALERLVDEGGILHGSGRGPIESKVKESG